MKKLLATILLAAGFFMGVGYTAFAAVTFRVVQTPIYHLYTGETSTATSIRITPYPTDLDGVKLVTADFGSSPTITVDPNMRGVEEIESFTTITDNGDNTATLSGITRSLASKYPYTTSGTGRTHGSSAIVVFGNNPQVYGRLAAPENPATVTGAWTFSSSSMPMYDVDPSAAQWSAANGREFVDLSKLNATAIAGAANSAESINGIGQLATGLQIASSTRLGSTGARLIIPASLATSSPGSNATSTVVVTDANAKIQSIFINKIQTYDWSALHTFYFGLTSNATTTLAASSTVGNALVLNTLPYSVSSSRGASSTVLAENGSGSLSWMNIPTVLAQKNSAGTNNGNSTTTIDSITIPANTLTTSSSLRVTAIFIGGNPAGCQFGISMGNGLSTTTIGFTSQQNFATPAMISGIIMATSTTNAVSMFHGNQPTNANSPVTGSFSNNSGWDMAAYPAYTFTSQTYIQFESRATGSLCNLAGITVEKLKQ